MATYVREKFTTEELEILARYFTNPGGPVFALKNLPQSTCGALFARWSRSPKSLARLFLDEFYTGEDKSAGPEGVGGTRASKLYANVLTGFGDDSVAQLGGAHLGCEQVSNILTKALEWGRLAAYLEQSTRYIPYDTPMPNGQFRYYKPESVMKSPLAHRYTATMDKLFQDYATLTTLMTEYFRTKTPRGKDIQEAPYERAVRAKALDTTRGLLPVATISNLGIYATGQAYELLIMRLRASELPEAREYADLMLKELKKVIPDFLERLDRAERGGVWVDYFKSNHQNMAKLSKKLFGGETPKAAPEVKLVDWERDGETKIIVEMLWPYTNLTEQQIYDQVKKMTAEERLKVVSTYTGKRLNRRHKPGRALEHTEYTFEVLSDYGAFRDLQRHRILTIDWQNLTPEHGYEVPQNIIDAGHENRYRAVIDSTTALYHDLKKKFPAEAVYALNFAFKLRYVMRFNAREAIHMLELRSGEQAHEVYRRISIEMHRQIRDIAKHTTVAAIMKYIGSDTGGAGLERLQAEVKNEKSGRRPA